MTYFHLAADCFLVEGVKDAALYDITGRRLFLLDEAAHAILSKCENQSLLEAAWLDPNGMPLLHILAGEGLGSFHAAPAYIDKLLPNAPIGWRGFSLRPPPFRKLDWSLTDECDVACDFCPRAESDLCWQACTGCLRRTAPSGATATLPADVESIVDQIAALGVLGVHIRGGNPLLEWERLDAVLRASARHPNFRVMVTTPGAGRPVEDIAGLYRYAHFGLNIVMFAIPGQNGGHASSLDLLAEQLNLADELKRRGLRFSVTYLLRDASPQTREAIECFAQKRWKVQPRYSEIHTKSAEHSSFSHINSKGKPLTLWRSIENFYFRVGWSTCLFGACEIAADGTIYPCAGLDKAAAEIAGGQLRPALGKDSIFDWWKSSKNDVGPCNRCALRYACADCRAAELVASPVVGARWCPFDPDGDVRACQSKWDHSGFVYVLSAGGEAGSNPCRKL